MPLPTPSGSLQQAMDIVAALRADLVTFSSGNTSVKRYQIHGREMEYRSTAEIIALLNHWQREVATMKAAERIDPPQRIYMRF